MILSFLTIMTLGSLLTIWTNSHKYISDEQTRIGYGDLSLWVSNVPEDVEIESEIENLPEIKQVTSQRIIYTNYEANGVESDSEGQLIVFDSTVPYRFFDATLRDYEDAPEQIGDGEVYVPASFASMMNVKVGDHLTVRMTRNRGNVSFVIRGFYEDPVMGSSMIGMKGLLISEQDYLKLFSMLQNAGIDSLARTGQILHVTAKESAVNQTKLLSSILTNTHISSILEFSHSKSVMEGFMLVLQNAFSGFLLAFVIVLVIVVLIILSYSIRAGIDSDQVNIGRLKTMGVTSREIRISQIIQYVSAIFIGMIAGLSFVPVVTERISHLMIEVTGVKIPQVVPLVLLVVIILALLILFTSFIVVFTRKIISISPMSAIREERLHFHRKAMPSVKKNLQVTIAIRQIITGKRNYISVLLIAVLLTFFVSMIGRMNIWLGNDGKGMMDAFNPADHDIGVQMFGSSSDEDARNLILSVTGITDSYELAMPKVTIGGTGLTANVITDPHRFHILDGRTSSRNDEIVITEFVASDMGVTIGDKLRVVGDSGSEVYTIVGIYSCANDMGSNIGMSKEAYLKIGRDDKRIWCHHYFLEHPERKYEVTTLLEQTYGGDIHVHENTWPGLFGIISAMQLLVILMYVLSAIFIFIATWLTTSRLLQEEKRTIGIYKSLGFTSTGLRVSFAIRFLICTGIGSIVGTFLSSIFADHLVSEVMKLEGISNFSANPTVLEWMLPGILITMIFTCFAFITSRKMKKTSMTVLISE
ncbi:hypothetical protein P261_02487 [Lachnospiraceae bacterium TWA4]|nr:hypothetical protein P261_02487 [Lachnospiraceae bacterium TWA4]